MNPTHDWHIHDGMELVIRRDEEDTVGVHLGHENMDDAHATTILTSRLLEMIATVQTGVVRDYSLEHEMSALPEKFRDPEALARFVIENEWALDSETSESGRADWRETLHRMHDAWDADTPECIVSTIAAAIRLDRHFRLGRGEEDGA